MCSWPAVAKFFFTDSESLKVCGLTMWNKPSFTMNEYLFRVFSYFQQLWCASCSYCLFYKFAIYCTTTWYELSCKKQPPPPLPKVPRLLLVTQTIYSRKLFPSWGSTSLTNQILSIPQCQLLSCAKILEAIGDVELKGSALITHPFHSPLLGIPFKKTNWTHFRSRKMSLILLRGQKHAEGSILA